MKSYFTFYILTLFLVSLHSQSQIPLSLNWQEDNGKQLILQNEGHDSGNLPVVFRRIPLSPGDSIQAMVVVEEEKRFSDYKAPENLSDWYHIISYTESDQGQNFGTVYLYPLRKNERGDVTALISGKLDIQIIPGRPRIRPRNTGFTSQSMLSEGRLVKIPITESKVYRINYKQLPEEWKTGSFDPDKLQLFTGHPGPLPYGVSDVRIDDLQEVAYFFDGTFAQQGDGLLFYGMGRKTIETAPEQGYLTIRHNVYADTNYYFLRYGVQSGKRMNTPDNLTSVPHPSISTGSDVVRYETDNYNILESIIQGSGRTWYTDAFTGTSTKDYSFLLKDQTIDLSQEILFSARFAGRSDYTNTATFTTGNKTLSRDIFSVEMAERYGIAARLATFHEKILMTEPKIFFNHQTRQGNSRGWMDFIEIAFKKNLSYQNKPLQFHSFETIENIHIENGMSELIAMDVTNPFNATLLPGIFQNKSYYFKKSANQNTTPQHLIVFNPAKVAQVDKLISIKNQNIHEIQSLDYLIVYHPLFLPAAQRLADHRRQHNGFEVRLVNIREIYNEFSSGKTDPSALRNFLKMLYSRGNSNMRVLLFGDGSFDYKFNTAQAAYSDENFIPVYETKNSHNPIRAFPSDDYYALLDDREGGDLKGALDISIGRIPVRTPAEADIIVQKILSYETGNQRFGDWRKEMLFVADDGNYNLFVGYTEGLSRNIDENMPQFQINKAYIDGSPKQITPNGVFSPKTNEVINNSAFEGQLIMNYQGHGSSKGWADEAILTKVDLEKWNNRDKYPILVTATCTFAGYDDPKEITAGEYSLVLPDKGAVALFSTTRVVYANSNDRLTNSIFNRLMEQRDDPPELGEWIRLAKNAHRSDTLDINARKFALLGDPAMQIALPKNQIIITAINGNDPASNDSILLGALQKVQIKGFVADYQGHKLTSFNGELSPTLFDKKKNLKTLGQGNDNYPVDYAVWQNVIYKGRASVHAGEFEFEFIVPRDINYEVGTGRLSLYADDGIQSDAWGLSENLLIGGTSDDPVENDQKGPDIEIYLGDKNFVSGDETEPNTVLLINIEDPSGINVSGNGIGHDLVYYMNDESASATVLNNYFKYELNSYSKGSVEFPLDNLKPGKHTLTIKVWDSHNNLSQKTVEFYVNEKDLAIENVLNYPNPFFDRTEFQFENPLIGEDLVIVIDIYTPSGRMAHRIIENRNTSGQMVRGIYWDGKDQWQQKLANGVYIYKVKIMKQAGDQTTRLFSDFQKLLLLN